MSKKKYKYIFKIECRPFNSLQVCDTLDECVEIIKKTSKDFIHKGLCDSLHLFYTVGENYKEGMLITEVSKIEIT